LSTVTAYHGRASISLDLSKIAGYVSSFVEGDVSAGTASLLRSGADGFDDDDVRRLEGARGDRLLLASRVARTL